MQKLKNLKLCKKSMVVAYWNRGSYKGPGTSITSDCCITIEFRNGETFAELWASAREARDIWPDLKGKRMTVVSRTDYSREDKQIETSRDRIFAASERQAERRRYAREAEESEYWEMYEQQLEHPEPPSQPEPETDLPF